MNPDKETKCHRTGFQMTCFTCVTEHNCRLWKRVELEFDPETGAKGLVKYDCIDSLADLYSKDMLRRQVQTTAEVNAFRVEAKVANNQEMLGAFARINRQVNQALPSLSDEAEPQKLIGN
jgi:hypothetical protein